MTIGQLDHNLRRFYAEARTQKGEPYSKSTLLGFRHGIERYLNSPPHSRGLQLASDPRFLRSNQMLDAQLINLKRSGKENVAHKPAIEEEHLQQLKASGVFSLSSPLSLLRNVWFHIVLFFLPTRPWRTESPDYQKLQIRCWCSRAKVCNHGPWWSLKKSSWWCQWQAQ